MASTDQPQSSYTSTRQGLHRVAAHILARRRFDVSGRFGLRASPGGIATPSFGEGPETIRVSGTTLVREAAGTAAYVSITGSSLRELAGFAGVDLDVAFSVGDETPALGDIDARLDLDGGALAVIADWYDLGWRVLDAVVADLPAQAAPATIQLWPEHFDAATNVGVASGERVNLGFSPGDAYEAQPYAYVGPWSPRRPGDPAFWNAPFGAVLRRADALASPDPAASARAFLRAGLAQAAA
jgi:hypothetical protein